MPRRPRGSRLGGSSGVPVLVPVRASPVPSVVRGVSVSEYSCILIRNHDDTHQSTRIGCLHERRSYSRVHTTPGSNVDTPIVGDTTRSRMASEVYLWAPKGISSSVVTHAPSPPGRMRLTSRQSISPWCATRRGFRHRREQTHAHTHTPYLLPFTCAAGCAAVCCERVCCPGA